MLKTRILTAVVLATCLIAVLFSQISIFYWVFGSLMVCLIALYEWASLAKLNQTQAIIFVAATTAVGAVCAHYWLDILNRLGYTALMGRTNFIFYFAALFWLLCVPFWLKYKFVSQHKWLMCALGVLLMTSLWLAFIFAKLISPRCVLSILATIWIADSAAYFAGKNFGKHKLAPTISPGKTWEGVYGALIGVTIFGVILYFYGGIRTPFLFLGLWLMTILGVMGDLFESLLKRQAGLKDSGHILPGHGGVLDRIDGIIPSFPLAILVIFTFFSDSFPA